MKKLMALSVFAVLGAEAFGNAVVRIVREPGAVAFALQRGYGVQKDGKHELTFTSVATGKTLLSLKSFTGKTASEDKKYFSQLERVSLPAENGKIKVTGRIFYCSFEQKFCSVQRVNEEL